MAGVFTVFNIGTGHTVNEPNSTIGRLYADCLGANKFANDGAGTGGGRTSNLFGKAQGRTMDPRCAAAVAKILEARPSTVNLAGHSRGAVMCHMIANDLAGSTHPAASGILHINMVVLDPVNMSVHTTRGGQIQAGVKLGSYVSIVMENVTKSIFPSKTVMPKDESFRGRMAFLHMPGCHGSGTQPLTSAIGLATFLTMQRCLYSWGSLFKGGNPKAEAICEAYARIHLDNPVHYDAKGNVKARLLSDDPKGQSTRPQAPAVTSQYQNVGAKRVKAIAANYEAMAKANLPGENLQNSPYFFNAFHLSCFAEAFPAIYGRFAGSFGNQVAVDLEIRKIEAGHRDIATSLARLGMI